MMGKGKSKVLTPLLTLYFILKHNKQVYIIVPEHLLKQTKKDMKNYINIFNLGNSLKITTDSKIKENFLDGSFNNIERNKNTIMLIDEFDTIIDPLQSNFNITNEKSLIFENIIKYKTFIDKINNLII
jgi:reverse gyrase